MMTGFARYVVRSLLKELLCLPVLASFSGGRGKLLEKWEFKLARFTFPFTKCRKIFVGYFDTWKIFACDSESDIPEEAGNNSNVENQTPDTLHAGDSGAITLPQRGTDGGGSE